jgi:hypothetical protein
VAQKERNLYGPGVVHDGGVPHGRSDDPLVRASVLLRPPGEALPHHGECELHDLSQHVVLRTKLETHVFNEKSYECNIFAVSYLTAVSAVWSQRIR